MSDNPLIINDCYFVKLPNTVPPRIVLAQLDNAQIQGGAATDSVPAISVLLSFHTRDNTHFKMTLDELFAVHCPWVYASYSQPERRYVSLLRDREHFRRSILRQHFRLLGESRR